MVVPKEIDRQIAVDALRAMDVKIDKLTKEQIKYAESWQFANNYKQLIF